LSVVHDRLVKVGLQDICLELHSKRANKKAVLAELARTLSLAPTSPSAPGLPTALTEARDQLNAIAQALHAPIGASGETPLACWPAKLAISERALRPQAWRQMDWPRLPL